MTRDPVAVPPDTTISQAAIEMRRHRFRHLPVAIPSAEGKALVGIVSKYDIARAFPHDLNPFSPVVNDATVPLPVSTIMSQNVITVKPDCAVEEAARLLRTRRINALPVVQHNRLIGLITDSDILSALLRITGANSGGIKIVLEGEDKPDSLLVLAQLSRRYDLRILSFLSFGNETAKQKTHCEIRYSGRPPAELIQDLRRLGYRIVSIG
jgi:acetoin utilization protein AcuB